MQTIRLRIAPSPTGNPHIGTIYQALFNYAYAKRLGGSFIVRIEDTDRERLVEGAEERIFAALDWFGLPEDESPRRIKEYGPYRQSERLDIYKKYAEELVNKSKAYYCFCTKERLENLRGQLQVQKKPFMYDKHCRSISVQEALDKKKTEPWVIRLKVPENETIVVEDQIRGKIEFDSNIIDDQVLLKSDGFPTYHLGVVVDDHLMEISHIVRGEEWISSAPKHVLLFQAFGWKIPLLYHTPLLRNPDKSKFSKRQGHTDVSWYQEHGFLPEAILNFIALMGWSHPQSKEIFPFSEFVDLFDLQDIKSVGPVFDLKKLEWMNGIYIRNLKVEQLGAKLIGFNSKLKAVHSELLYQLIALSQTRMNTLSDFFVLTNHFFEEPILEKVQDTKIVSFLHTNLAEVQSWNKDAIFSILRKTLDQFAIKMPVLYTIFTGSSSGLPLAESLELLGKDKTIKRLEQQL